MTASISVLLPTRGRPEGLRTAVYSMIDLAAEPGRLEFLFRTDDDDASAMSIVLRDGLIVRGRFPPSFYELGGPRLGYRRVFEHFNEMAALAKGDYLINWNDDAEMLTPGWDDKLRERPPSTVQFMRRNILEHADTTFPVTGRAVYEAMGHLSLQTHADDWVGKVAQAAGVAVFRDDVVFRHHRLSDQTSWDRDRDGYDVDGFNSPEMVALRQKDVEAIKRSVKR